ncbi:MAG: M20/M25/M40 family metallo-hydrolase [Planctomycetota bacterium]
MSLKILQTLCSLPTAPFVEDRPLAYVDAFAEKRKRLRASQDKFGNRLVELPGTSDGPRLVFVAHLDHPGMVADEMAGKRTLHAVFRGGVYADYLPGTKVRFFDLTKNKPTEIAGTIQDVTANDRGRATHVVVKVKQPVPSGAPGMFDVGTGRIDGERFHCRCCDDLAGASAILAALDRLHRAKHPPKQTVAALFTRGEEDGFIGAIAAARRPKLLKKSDRVLSIECSAEQPAAQQGKGVVLRVGDLTSIFDSPLTSWMASECAALAKSDETFKFTRALMPGGTCEATPFNLWGFTAAAVCVPLGNYHNMAPPTANGKKKIAAEHIHLDDWRNMVELFVRLGREHHGFDPKLPALRERLERRFADHEHLLAAHVR